MKDKLINIGVVSSIFGAGWWLEWCSKSYAGVALVFVGLAGWAVIRVFEAKEAREFEIKLKAANDQIAEHERYFRRFEDILLRNNIM